MNARQEQAQRWHQATEEVLSMVGKSTINKYGSFHSIWVEGGNTHQHELYPDTGECLYTIDGLECECTAAWAHDLAIAQDAALLASMSAPTS